ncbi:MAG: DUF86 domain-containing protein [Anaerolineae bacterium]|nr:DUF86 domain-containing protein [Anaerolineae bacterium]MCB0222981.1 DUF86 domain-containing protein [Anaerolineae bacterium]
MSFEFLDYVEDILDAMEKAELLLDGVTYDQFQADFRINFAVVRALEIVGEATKRLPLDLRQQYPGIPWKGMAGMRDRIIHSYDNVDLEIVWDVVKQDIPRIKPQIQQILADYEGRE